MFNAVKIRDKKDKYYAEILELYSEAFPQEECFPVDDLANLVKLGSGIVYAFEHVGRFIGGAYGVEDGSDVFLLFLAVTEAARGNGCGTMMLDYIKNEKPGRRISLLIETLNMRVLREIPDNIEQRRKRESFYIKNGYEYASLSTHEPGGIFDMMVNGEQPAYDEMINFFNKTIGGDLLDRWQVKFVNTGDSI